MSAIRFLQKLIPAWPDCLPCKCNALSRRKQSNPVLLFTVYFRKQSMTHMKIICSALLCIFLFSNCSKDDKSGSDGPITPIVTAGGWHVSLFSERNNDETSDFSGYNFTFQPDGKLIAVKGAVTKTGSWSESTSSNKLIIDLGSKSDSNKPLGELTDDWYIISHTDSKISLTDDNATREEKLEFTRH